MANRLARSVALLDYRARLDQQAKVDWFSSTRTYSTHLPARSDPIRRTYQSPGRSLDSSCNVIALRVITADHDFTLANQRPARLPKAAPTAL